MPIGHHIPAEDVVKKMIVISQHVDDADSPNVLAAALRKLDVTFAK